jgi:type IV pilus assembly protein PilW
MFNQRGFSLIEMMVGIAIGLVGMLAVTQVLVTFNQNRNATTQTMESQNNGTMALYVLERDLTQAGYGLMSIQSCATINWYYNGTAFNGVPGATPPTTLTTLPVKITDGGAASDTIDVQYAKSSSGVPATLISGQSTYPQGIVVASVVGIETGNLVVADVSGVCTLYSVYSASVANGVNTVTRSLARDTNLYNPLNAPAPGWNQVQPNNTLINLGSSFVGKRYSISASGMDASAFPTYTVSTLVDGIAFMKAEYGRDTNADGAVDVWSSGAWVPDNTTANQVIALRIGIVARSTEKIAVNAPSSFMLLPEIKDAAGVTIGAQVAYTPPDVSYRYKSYYTVIPLRNVIWNN